MFCSLTWWVCFLYARRDTFSPAQKDSEMEDAEESENIERGLDNAMEAEDITAVTPVQEQVSCCADQVEHTPAPSASKSKPTLVIGLAEREAGLSKFSGDVEGLDKDDDFADDPVLEGVRFSSLNKSADVEFVGASLLGEYFHKSTVVVIFFQV